MNWFTNKQAEAAKKQKNIDAKRQAELEERGQPKTSESEFGFKNYIAKLRDIKTLVVQFQTTSDNNEKVKKLGTIKIQFKKLKNTNKTAIITLLTADQMGLCLALPGIISLNFPDVDLNQFAGYESRQNQAKNLLNACMHSLEKQIESLNVEMNNQNSSPEKKFSLEVNSLLVGLNEALQNSSQPDRGFKPRIAKYEKLCREYLQRLNNNPKIQINYPHLPSQLYQCQSLLERINQGLMAFQKNEQTRYRNAEANSILLNLKNYQKLLLEAREQCEHPNYVFISRENLFKNFGKLYSLCDAVTKFQDSGLTLLFENFLIDYFTLRADVYSKISNQFASKHRKIQAVASQITFGQTDMEKLNRNKFNNEAKEFNSDKSQFITTLSEKTAILSRYSNSPNANLVDTIKRYVSYCDMLTVEMKKITIAQK